jgi:hypothetical protein
MVRPVKRDLSEVQVQILRLWGEDQHVEINNGLLARGSHYLASIRDPALPGTRLLVSVEVFRGDPHCATLVIQADPGAPPITGTHLRDIPLKAYLERTLDEVTLKEVDAEDMILAIKKAKGSTVADEVAKILTPSESEIAAVRRRHPNATPEDAPVQVVRKATPEEVREARRRRPRSETLPLVVEEYRKALDDPDPAVRRAPTQAVADRLGFKRGHVSRLLSAARTEGLLGAASPGVAGEAPEGEDEGDRS